MDKSAEHASLQATRWAISNHGLRNSGGIERYAMTLVRGLHERGIKPIVLAKKFDASLPEYGWVHPIALGASAVPAKLRDLYFDWRIGRVKRRLGLGPLIACNQTRWSDIGICGSTHPGFLEAMNLPTRRSDRWKIALERAHLERSRVVVAHSARMRDEAVRYYGIDPGKVVLLYPPVDAARFSTVTIDARARLRAELGFAPEKAVFVLASTGHSRKGLDILAPWFAQTELPVTLVVAGRPLEREWPNVRYLGYRDDIENVYRAADFTMMASRYEPFGLVGVESVLCGTPVLVERGAGCAEVIRGAQGLAFTLADHGDLGRAIEVATQLWRDGRHRIDDPRSALAYDPSVAAHVDALLALVARFGDTPLDQARR